MDFGVRRVVAQREQHRQSDRRVLLGPPALPQRTGALREGERLASYGGIGVGEQGLDHVVRAPPRLGPARIHRALSPAQGGQQLDQGLARARPRVGGERDDERQGGGGERGDTGRCACEGPEQRTAVVLGRVRTALQQPVQSAPHVLGRLAQPLPRNRLQRLHHSYVPLLLRSAPGERR
ncbi:hypothetical protein OG426_47365 [Streptomyces canus]|uniref:hypothetical protein n=1 Tax=Streptomyces canus TaxID=58343 RepID=UPI00225791AD|nr:hypothetical protein [Streptomyces canus]MCX4855091.1 hypothetical protein [Streptomyces canus]WSW39513.1 hypothetical protein OG426_47365 [Streptomyces canus]